MRAGSALDTLRPIINLQSVLLYLQSSGSCLLSVIMVTNLRRLEKSTLWSVPRRREVIQLLLHILVTIEVLWSIDLLNLIQKS